MESIDKLREYGHDCCARIDDAIHDYCDEIEREIEDRIDDLMTTSVDGYPEPFNTPDAMHMVLGTAADCFDTPQEAVHYLRGETSMELPLDADGVPIRPREEVSTGMGDNGPIGHLEYWYPNHWVAVIEYKPGQFTRYDPAAIRHVKPRTVEDVLREFGKMIANSASYPCYEDVRKYADELRNMGVVE